MLARLQGSSKAAPPLTSLAEPDKPEPVKNEATSKAAVAVTAEALDAAFLEALRQPGPETLLGSVYAGVAAKRRAAQPQQRRAATAQDKALESAMTEMARTLRLAGAKHLTAMLPWFDHWLVGYARFVASVREAGYEFRTFEALREGVRQRSIFMRYDIHHLRDLPPALGFVEANRLLGVEAEFHLPLGYSRQYAEAIADYEMLASWFSEVSRPAFHAASFESHLIWTYFGGDEFAFTRWTRTPEALAFVSDAIAGRDTPYGNLDTLMAKADETFLAQASKFKAIFPEAVACSGHGGALNARLSGILATDSAASALHQLMGSRQFITEERAKEAGFVGESFEASVRFGMDYVSDRPDGPFTVELQAAIDAGRSAVLVVHPALLQRGHYGFEVVRVPGGA
jgi:hypothetical protein